MADIQALNDVNQLEIPNSNASEITGDLFILNSYCPELKLCMYFRSKLF